MIILKSKRIIWIIFGIACIIVAVFAFCLGMSASKDHNIGVDTIQYYDEDKNIGKYINITYHILAEMNDKNVETLINGQIQAKSLAILDDFTAFDNMTITSSWEVSLLTENIFSIKGIENSFHKVQAYPLVRFNSLIFDLSSGNRLGLEDIVYYERISLETFFDYFQNISTYDSEENKILADNYVRELLNAGVLSKCDNDSYNDCHSYLTRDSLVISFAVPTSSGSYALYESKFSTLTELLKVTLS